MAASPVLRTLLAGKKPLPAAMLWADANGDGRVQDDEMKFVRYTQALTDYVNKSRGVALPADKATPVLPSWGDAAKDKGIYDIMLWAARSAPKFENPGGVGGASGTDDLPMPADMNWRHTDNRSETYRWADEQGNRYLERNIGGEKAFGRGFWSPRVGGNRVLKWDKTGKLLWEVGLHAPGSQARPGEAKYLWRVMGLAHGCIVVGDVEESAARVWDQDGLWAGNLLDNPDLKAAPAAAYYNPTENFGGTVYENPGTGEVLYFAGGVNSSPVYRIRGWDSFIRQSGVLPVSAQVARKIVSAATAEANRSDVAYFQRIDKVTLDGDLSEWKDVKPIHIKDGDKTVANVYLGWNRGQKDFNTACLFVAFDVTTDKPWKSAATPQLAFQGGASVDVKLGKLEPAGRREAGLYDVRLVAAPLDGAGEGSTPLIEFAPRRAGSGESTAFNWTPGQRKPATYETGNGKVTFNRVGALFWPRMPKLVNAFTKIKAGGTGYVVEMRSPVAPPLTTLPLDTYPGVRFRFDAGLALSNTQGNHVETRLTWNSKDPGDMADNDVYTEALLRPQNWGYGVLK
jgi:hypothetical protein